MTVYESHDNLYELKYMYLGEYAGGTKREGMGLYCDRHGDMYYGHHSDSTMKGAYIGINNDGEKFIAFFQDNVLKKAIKMDQL
jgi:hypothetical protein